MRLFLPMLLCVLLTVSLASADPDPEDLGDFAEAREERRLSEKFKILNKFSFSNLQPVAGVPQSSQQTRARRQWGWGWGGRGRSWSASHGGGWGGWGWG